MSVKKTGFVFYFDSYPMLLSLPREERGDLLTFLCVYGDRVWREPDTKLEDVLEQFPLLSDQGKLACRFLGQALLRDTERWHSTIEARQKKKQEREMQPPSSSADLLARRRQELTGGWR